MKKLNLTTNYKEMNTNRIENFKEASQHENYLEVEKTFYEFMKNEKKEGMSEGRDFCSVFIYL